MDETEREELKEAYRKEKDPRVVARMLAVHMVYVAQGGHRRDRCPPHAIRPDGYATGYTGMTKEALMASGIFPGAADREGFRAKR